jgi:hypothetical protein
MPYVRLATVQDLHLIHRSSDVQKLLNDVEVAKKLEYNSVTEKEWKDGAKFKFILKQKRQQLKSKKKTKKG